MANPANMRAEYDITDRVHLGKDGNPEFAEIDAVALELLKDLEESMYGKTGA